MGRSHKGLNIIIYISLVINAVAIVLSLIGDFKIRDFAGYIYLIAICINLLTIFLNFINFNALNDKGKILKIICYVFLAFFFFALFLLIFKQIIFVTEMDPTSNRYLIADLIHKIAYFGILGFGVILSLFDLKYLNRLETWI